MGAIIPGALGVSFRENEAGLTGAAKQIKSQLAPA